MSSPKQRRSPATLAAAFSQHRYATAWPVVWALTSVLVVLAGLQIESGGFVAALYLGLNACTVLYELLGSRSIKYRTTLIIGWCAAVQLPVMLWLYTNRNRAPERFTEARLLESSGQPSVYDPNSPTAK